MEPGTTLQVELSTVSCEGIIPSGGSFVVGLGCDRGLSALVPGMGTLERHGLCACALKLEQLMQSFCINVFSSCSRGLVIYVTR